VHVVLEVLEPSHVLLAIGRDSVIARRSLRFTLGRFTRGGRCQVRVEEILPGIVKKDKKNLTYLLKIYCFILLQF